MDEAWSPPRPAWSLRRLEPLVLVGGSLVALIVLLAVLAPWISPHDPLAQVLTDRLKPPAWLPGGSLTYLLGTDANGRDLLSRILWGARTSLEIGLLTVILGAAIGVTAGLVAGYRGGWLATIVGRLADIQQAIPLLILALAVIAMVGSSILNLVLVLGIGSWLYYYRIVRGEVLAIRERPYIDAARATGVGGARILVRHILPNVAGSIIVIVTLELPQVILFTAGLTFLGLGVPPPTPEWGRLIFDGRDYLQSAWWLTVEPAAVLVLFVLGVNLLGDALRDRIDPARRQGPR
ncbi:MAG TPA: ABC transporter permease [Candidatus Limnocylindrales bacterium]|nr:ABC transporter permease [Candidatus Limnocylindrales bacterium]